MVLAGAVTRTETLRPGGCATIRRNGAAMLGGGGDGGCVVGRDGFPSVVLDGHAGLSGSSWLEGDVELGAEIRREAGVAPGEYEQPRRCPRADGADHEGGPVVVRLDEPSPLASLKGEGAGAPFAELEQTVGLPPLGDLCREAGESFGRLAGYSCGHENPGPVRAHGAGGCTRRTPRVAGSNPARSARATDEARSRVLGTARRHGLESRSRAEYR